MSVSEILAQLPKLESSERELICQRVLAIQQRHTLRPSAALTEAIAEADAAKDEDCLNYQEMQEALRSWNSK